MLRTRRSTAIYRNVLTSFDLKLQQKYMNKIIKKMKIQLEIKELEIKKILENNLCGCLNKKNCKNNITMYILSLENDKYYVGVTHNLDKRFEEHYNGFGSEWTKKYRPINIFETMQLCKNSSDFNYKEDNKVLEYMNKYGIDNVRGGSYSQIKQNNDELKKRLNHSNNTCFYCGETGHYINRCPKKLNFKFR